MFWFAKHLWQCSEERASLGKLESLRAILNTAANPQAVCESTASKIHKGEHN